MKFCPVCEARFNDTVQDCDNHPKVQLCEDQFIGRHIGPYRVNGYLGRGGMAVVYRVLHGDLRIERALKVMRSEYQGVEELSERFKLEARILAQLDSEYIVRVHDLGQVDGRCYMVLDLLRGRTLRSELAGGLFGVERAAQVVTGIAHGLLTLGPLQLVHRDVKPENVFLLIGPLGERPCLFDFNAAHSAVPGKRLTDVKAREFIGTPDYAAPEVVEGEGELSDRTDIYSLGVLFYEAITGVLPYAVEPRQRLQEIRCRQPCPIVPARTRLKDLDVEIDELLLEMLDDLPARRPDAAEVIERLRAVVSPSDAERLKELIACAEAEQRRLAEKDAELARRHELLRDEEAQRQHYWTVREEEAKERRSLDEQLRQNALNRLSEEYQRLGGEEERIQGEEARVQLERVEDEKARRKFDKIRQSQENERNDLNQFRADVTREQAASDLARQGLLALQVALEAREKDMAAREKILERDKRKLDRRREEIEEERAALFRLRTGN